MRIPLLAALFFPIALPVFASVALPAKPNVVVVLTDDQGWGDLSVHGNTNLKTPNIDSLARDGASFDRFFVCPVCSPTRAELLTGRYHPRGGVFSTSTGGERLDLDEHTVAQSFKAAGYATAAFGKWHNGLQHPYHPNARGFDEFYGFCSGHWGHYFSPELEHNGKLVRGDGYVIDDFTNRAMKFIEQNKDRPFFCYLPFSTPHSPMQVPDRFYRKFDGADLKLRNRNPRREDLGHTRAALAMCENIDWNVGRLLQKLDELKLAENTIVVYFSDNGPNGWRWNGGMKGRKGSTDEGGVRVPMFVRWPGTIPRGQKVSQIAAGIDLFPTLADLCDVPAKNEKPFDGVSLKRLLIPEMRELPPAPERMIFSHWAGRVSVRTQRYRLDNAGKLFDMTADPGQRKDVAGEHPETAARLRAAVAKWRKEVLAELTPKHTRPFPVGYRASPVTHLPARDGVPHGNVKRSNRAPNCSYFTNWTSTDDRITWDVQVENAGRYEATVYYTCTKRDAGTEIELSLGDAAVKTTIAAPHDPPLVGLKQDRSDRGSESFVKDFKPHKMGTLELKKGRGQLALKALKIPGEQSIDVRYVVLTLQNGDGDGDGDDGENANAAIVPPGAKLERLWNDGEFTEGVAVAPDGSIYFSDIPFNRKPGRVLKFDPKAGKTTVHCGDSGKSNGLMFDRKGRLIAVCGAMWGRQALVEITPDGNLKSIAGKFEGKRFNSPNDLVVHPQGWIYFSDPRYAGDEKMEIPHMSVYRYNPATGRTARATEDVEKPNGVALSPDGKTLYVAETNNGSTDVRNKTPGLKPGRMTLNAFPVKPDGSLGRKKVLVDFGRETGTDGMTVDSRGNIYAAVRSAKRFGVVVYNPQGKELARIPTPELPTNCCFGRGGESSTLYITAGTGLYRIRLKTPGHHPATAKPEPR